MRKEEELWWFVAACGIEIIAIGVGVMISPTLGWVIALVGFLLMAYAVFRIFKARSRWNRILEELAKFIPEGDSIRDRCINDQKGEVPEKEALAWAAKVEDYLFKNIGSVYGSIFLLSDGLGRAKIPPMYSNEHQRIALFVSYRLMRIDLFLAELRQT